MHILVNASKRINVNAAMCKNTYILFHNIIIFLLLENVLQFMMRNAIPNIQLNVRLNSSAQCSTKRYAIQLATLKSVLKFQNKSVSQ